MAISRKPKGCLFWVGVFGIPPLLLLLLGAGVWWYLTTDAGFRKYILPRISKAAGVELNVEGADWSPFSSLKLKKIRVGNPDQPLMAADEVFLSYDGMEWLKGKYHVSLIEVRSPVLTLTRNAKGEIAEVMTLQEPPPGTSSPEVSSASDTEKVQMVAYHLDRVKLENMKIQYQNGGDSTVLDGLQAEIRDIRPEGKIHVEGESHFLHEIPNSTVPYGKDRVEGRVSVNLDLQVDYRLIPGEAKGRVHLKELKGGMGKQRLDGYSAAVNLELAAPSGQRPLLKDATLEVRQDGKLLTRLSAVGPFDLGKREADLDIQVGPLKSDVLNVLFASRKLDFLDSSLGYTGHVGISKGGQSIFLQGKLEALPLNLASPDIPAGAWKPLQVSADHTLEVDYRLKRILLQRLRLEAIEKGRKILTGELNQPMLATWSSDDFSDANIPDSELALQLFPTDVLPYRAFFSLPEDWKIRSGTMEMTARICALESGRKLSFEGRLMLKHLAMTSPRFNAEDAEASFDGRASIHDMNSLMAEGLSVKVSEKGKAVAAGTLDGKFQFKERSGKGILKMEASLPGIQSFYQIPQVSFAAGTVAGMLDWKVDQGRIDSSNFDLQCRDMDLTLDQVRYLQMGLALTGTFQQEGQFYKVLGAHLESTHLGQPGGILLGDFSWNANGQSWVADFQMKNLKTPVWVPIFQAYLPGRSLQSIDLTGEGHFERNPTESLFKGSLDLKNLLVRLDGMPGLKPLNAKLVMDLGLKNSDTWEIREFNLQLDPVGTAKNTFHARGSIKNTPAVQRVKLDIKGESLDLTAYYHQLMFTPETKKTPTGATTVPVGLSPAGSSVPKGDSKSARDIQLDVDVDSLKVDKLTLTQLKIPFRLKGDFIELNQARAELGGVPILASIKSDGVDGKPSFRLDASTQDLNLEPIIDVLKPSLRGKVGGRLNMKIQGSGKGLEMADLVENLEGTVELSIRDAHLERTDGVKSALQQLGAKLESPQIAESTLNQVEGSGRVSKGKIHTDNLHFIGSSIEPTLRGDLMFDQRLNMEAILKIRRDVMSQSAFLSQLIQVGGTQQGEWIRAPGGASVTGTLGEPVVDIDRKKFVGEAVVNTGLKILQDIFSKDKKKEGDSPSENPDEKKKDPLDFFKKLIK